MSKKKIAAMRQYVFRSGSRVSGIDATVAGNELERIHQRHGALRPVDVVDAARPDTAPLHPAFEWRDAVAAEEWRKVQAQNLIRSVQVVSENEEQAPVYVSVQTEQEREYQPLEVVVNKPDLYGMAIHEAQQRINAAKKALHELEAAASDSEVEQRHLAAIQIAMQALATASGAVEALH